jgi:hypothetical protein
MDHAAALVEAYLQLNGYFTSAEYPILARAGHGGAGRRGERGMEVVPGDRASPRGVSTQEPKAVRGRGARR